MLAVKQPVMSRKVVNISKLSQEYLAYVQQAKYILNNSSVKSHPQLVDITNVKEEIGDKLQAMVLRIVNFSNKGKKIIVFNDQVIFVPEWFEKEQNNADVDEVNKYFLERFKSKEIDKMLARVTRPITCNFL